MNKTAYLRERQDALSRLNLLTHYLESENGRNAENKNWGHIGSLIHVNKELHAICAFLGLEKE